MELGKSKRSSKWEYKMGQEITKKSKEEKDLGVVIQHIIFIHPTFYPYPYFPQPSLKLPYYHSNYLDSAYSDYSPLC